MRKRFQLRTVDPFLDADMTSPQQHFLQGRAGVALVRLAILLVFLVAWELSSGLVLDSYWLSRPSLIGVRLYEWIVTGFIWIHLQATLTAAVVGFALGAGSGIVLGLLLGAFPFLSDVLRPYIVAFYAIPKIALVPLLILWLGVGMISIIVLVMLTVLFPVFYNTFSGVRNVDKELIDSVRILGAGRLALWAKVIIPASAAWIFTGLKISVRYGLTTTIYGELIGGNRGIGYLLEFSAGRFDTTGIMSAIVILVLLGLLLVWAVSRTENKTKC